jgi:hypothetical protein
MHQPRFSSGEHGDSGAVRSFWDELYAADAELVVVGHDHDYERFAPQSPDGTPDDARGMVQIVVGTGGGELEAFRQARRNSLVRIDDAHGVLELTLGEDRGPASSISLAWNVTRAAGTMMPARRRVVESAHAGHFGQRPRGLLRYFDLSSGWGQRLGSRHGHRSSARPSGLMPAWAGPLKLPVPWPGRLACHLGFVSVLLGHLSSPAVPTPTYRRFIAAVAFRTMRLALRLIISSSCVNTTTG